MQKALTLSVQSAGNKKWRLGLSTIDSREEFTHLESVNFILSVTQAVECNAACGTSKKKAFDFNRKKLSEWIIKKGYHIYPYRKPTRLIFDLTIKANQKTLTFIRKQTIK